MPSWDPDPVPALYSRDAEEAPDLTPPELQECRGCGLDFPYDPEADYCPDCVKEMHP